ncbi:MAG: gliding motility-associated C-terminal domain-containing protein [Flavobacteriia bacterium]|nr:gliding motility-associated C-terminal domain-containing protein [Flavobacteriia bacterium]
MKKLPYYIKKAYLIACLIWFFLISFNFWAQSPVKFETPGTYTWTVPPCVTSITVKVWGAGGGGGGARSKGDSGKEFGYEACAGAGGGGGGGYTEKTFTVIPGQTYNIVVGAGGAGGSVASILGSGGINTTTVGTGSNGGLSSFDGYGQNMIANGGNGGNNAVARRASSYDYNQYAQAAGGNGGTASGGTLNFTGGKGSYGYPNGSKDHGSAGGGAAGANGNGGNPTPTDPGGPNTSNATRVGGSGNGPASGNGGNGQSTGGASSGVSLNGNNGGSYGGGAAGGLTHSESTADRSATGGTGANGAVIIEYSTDGSIPAIPTITSTPASCSAAGTSTISNYNAAYTYTFTPAGPTVGAGGSISNMTTGTNYTVTASSGSCPSNASASFSNAAQLSTPTAPTAAPQSFCGSATVANLTPSGTGISWYSAASGGSPLTGSTALATGTYYVSQTTGGCESSRTPVAVTVTAKPAAPTITSTPASCSAAGTSSISNYNAAYTYTFTPAGPTVGTGGSISSMTTGINYTVTASSGSCPSSASVSFNNAAQLSTPTAPTAAPQSFCGSATVTNLAPSGTGISWYSAASGGTPLAGSTALATGTYYVSQTTAGCESNRTSVAVTVTAKPAAPTITSTPASCSAAGTSTISNYNAAYTYTFTPAGPTVNAGGSISNMTTGTNYTVTASSGSCPSDASTSFSNAAQLGAATPPTASAQNFCGAGTVANLVPSGTGISWYSAASGGSPLAGSTALATGTYYVSQTAGGCESSRTPVVVTVSPTPVANAGADVTINCGQSVQIGESPATPESPLTPAGCATAASMTQKGGYYINSVSTTGGHNNVNISNPNTKVQGSMPNTNTSQWYSDYTSQVVEVCAGSSFGLTAAVAHAGGSNPKSAVRVWIDWNNDGTFSNPSEIAYTTALMSGSSYSHTMTINVPAGQAPGVYRMRIRVKDNDDFAANDKACDSKWYGWGSANALTNSDEIEDYTVKVVNCSGGGSGSNPGSATYSWTPSESLDDPSIPNPTATPTQTTTYTVTVTTGPGCTATDQITVTVNKQKPVFSAFGPYCEGESVSLPATSNDGVSGTWNPSPVVTTIAGSGAVYTFTPSNVCKDTVKVKIVINANPTKPVISKTNPTCTATEISTISNYNSSYTYTFSPTGPVIGTGGVISGMTTGQNYTVTVKNGNCTATSDAFSNADKLSAPSITVETITPASCGSSNGSIDISVSGGTAPYTYSWSNGSTAQNLSGVTAGTYTVTVTDDNGCTATNGTGTTITNSSGPSVTVGTVINASCGNSNGSINISVSGGAAPYTFAWSNGSTAQNLSGVTAGTYTVTVTDDNGCTATNGTGTPITDAPAPTVSIGTVTNASCGNSNGSINISVSGGTAPYTYSWSNGSTAQNLSGISAGTYTVTVTDDNGCTATNGTGTTITNTSAPIVSVGTITSASCGSSNGGINISVSGGTAPYTYSWSNGSTAQNLSGVPAGNYTVTVTDDNGCTATNGTGTTITNTSAPTVTVGTITPASCGSNNGSINISVSGGTAPYTYSWSNGATSQNLSGAPAGNYTVTVTDNNGCTATNGTGTTITNTSAPTVTVGTITPASCGSNNGSINISVSGGTAPYTYSWSNGATSQNLSGAPAGNYTVTVTDNNGCTATNGTGTIITNTSTPTITVGTVTNASCGSNNGSVNISVSGGTAPYTYSWSNGSTSQNLSGMPAGTYIVTVTDVNGCTKNGAATISYEDTLHLAIVADTTKGCSPLVVKFSSSITNADSYSWNFGDGTISGSSNPVHTFIGDTCFNVSLSVAVGGCTTTVKMDSAICAFPTPEAAFIASTYEITNVYNEVYFTNQSQNATSYDWYFGDETGHSTKEHPKYVYDPEIFRNYTVILVAKNDKGCTDTTRVVIKMSEDIIFYVPNTFTPDGDEFNNIFKPVIAEGYDNFDYEMLVFDRWGEIIFETHNTKVGWDGTYLGKKCPEGTYVWKIIVKKREAVEKIQKIGHVTLLR